jgi:hypothetical protein
MPDEPNIDAHQMWAIGKVAGVLDVSPQTALRLAERGEFGEVYKMGKTDKRGITRVKAMGVIGYITRSQRKNGNGHDGENA